MPGVLLAGPADWDGFVRAARWLVHERVPPAEAAWRVAGEGDGLFDDAGGVTPAAALPEAPALRLPSAWVERARWAALHADAGRHALLYRMLWRVLQQRAVAADPLDADGAQLERLAGAARREAHKMKAFVRFRPVAQDEALRHVAWFEPGHHVQEAVAPFFARRFAQMAWAILTPRIAIAWDGRELCFGPGARRADAPDADAGEALWLAYYRSIFNPARLKVAMMRKEMPVRFWPHLPEARLIAPLVAQAAERTGRMLLDEPPGDAQPRRRGRALEAPSPADTGTGTDTCTDDDAAPAPPLRGAAALAALARDAAGCRACAFADCATQTVWGEGDPQARLMLVGEQPGDREDLEGRPFVGPAGELLHGAFAALGWPAERLYLTNAVKHFKFEWRGRRRLHKTAAQREAAACAGWLEPEIAAVQPAALVALGATAARSLLGRPVSVQAHAGQWLQRADGRAVLVVRHPAALLRLPAAERAAAVAQWHGQLRAAATWVAPTVAGGNR